MSKKPEWTSSSNLVRNVKNSTHCPVRVTYQESRVASVATAGLFTWEHDVMQPNFSATKDSSLSFLMQATQLTRQIQHGIGIQLMNFVSVCVGSIVSLENSDQSSHINDGCPCVRMCVRDCRQTLLEPPLHLHHSDQTTSPHILLLSPTFPLDLPKDNYPYPAAPSTPTS